MRLENTCWSSGGGAARCGVHGKVRWRGGWWWDKSLSRGFWRLQVVTAYMTAVRSLQAKDCKQKEFDTDLKSMPSSHTF